jgi:GH15 family glucan-1,4-alpha-glucosidase
MKRPGIPFIPYPPIARHGVIGDRRTGALVAADGTLNWFCVPEFDGEPVFGALLDAAEGGFCRWGPESAVLGRQRYLPGTAVLLTTWPETAKYENIELADVMAFPEEERAEILCGQRIIIRRLRVKADATVSFALFPRRSFAAASGEPVSREGGAIFPFVDGTLGFWASFSTSLERDGAFATFSMRAGDEHWVVLGWNVQPEGWEAPSASRVFAEAENYWRDWSAGLDVSAGGTRAGTVQRSALTVQLLSHVHHECSVAALTSSLPERIGGDKNYDYRYAWVRDASLSLALLARLGNPGEVQHYLSWLSGLDSAMKAPLQVCYRLDGNPHMDQEDVEGIAGYENSQPVRRGNRAAKQMQLGSMGFFADCARIYLDRGGEWRDEFWQLLKRAADFTCKHWKDKDSGVWELPEKAHYVASRVMSWVVLERAVYIAGKTGCTRETDHWRETAAAIHAEVMEKGWCEEKNAFRQRYNSDAMDAAALLIPLMDFLPADHPRVAGTFAAIERELVIDGLVHRFDPSSTIGGEQPPIGQFEGAFLPCVFWHAHALAKAGRCDEAEAILAKCESIAGELGIFAEEADARHNILLGNTPLLFSHVEYVRAVLELNEARARSARDTTTL